MPVRHRLKRRRLRSGRCRQLEPVWWINDDGALVGGYRFRDPAAARAWTARMRYRVHVRLKG